MNQIVTTGAVLARTNYGEADRIVTLLTPDHGKVRVMARGVRKAKSKLAGGIELFSVSDITFARGKGEIGTLVSTRLKTHFGRLLGDIDRTMEAYELIKLLDKSTEDSCEPEYFELLTELFAALDDIRLPMALVRTWFFARLLNLHGFSPDLMHDTTGKKLHADGHYTFDFDAMTLASNPDGQLASQHIKLLRLFYGHVTPAALARVQGMMEHLQPLVPLVEAMKKQHLRV